MDEKDFARIEELFTKLSEDVTKKLALQSEDLAQLAVQSVGLDKKLTAQSKDLAHLAVRSEELDQKLTAQSKDFSQWLGVQGDRFQDKLDLVVDGYQALSEKLDRVEINLSEKIDVVAADLSAHRTDTEAHHGVYRVKEEDEEFGK